MSRSGWIALIMMIVVVGWIVSGQIGGDPAVVPADATAIAGAPGGAGAERPKQRVRVRTVVAEPYVAALTLRGRTEAARRVTLRSEIEARVVDLPKAKGARLAAGDLVARLATDDRSARLRQMRAVTAQRELEFAASDQLAQRGFASNTKRAESLANLEASRAELTRMEQGVANTRIIAPFSGILSDRPAEIGSFVQVGEVIGTLLELDPILFVGAATERDVTRIKVGQRAEARLFDGRRFEGRVRFVAVSAEPTTRTYRVEVEVANPEGGIADGLTAELIVPVATLAAHRLTSAVLALDDKGRLGVKLVVDGVVQFQPVTLVGNADGAVWLAGLPETAVVVSVGQELVAAGEAVEIVADSSITGARSTTAVPAGAAESRP